MLQTNISSRNNFLNAANIGCPKSIIFLRAAPTVYDISQYELDFQKDYNKLYDIMRYTNNSMIDNTVFYIVFYAKK